MRCLTPSEFEPLQVRTHIPPDLTTSFFPVMLQSSPEEDYRLDCEHTNSAVERTAQNLSARNIFYMPEDNRYLDMNSDCVSDFRNYSFSIGKGVERRERISKLIMFSINDLVFGPDLKKLGIAQEPGYIYFGTSISNERHAFGAYLFEYEYNHRRPKKHYYHENPPDSVFFEDLIDVTAEWHGQRKISSKKLIDIQTHERIWIGAIADIAHVTNSLVLCSVASKDDHTDYILKTPLEYPPGFVRETAKVLKESSSFSDEFVNTFQELVFTKTTPPKRRKPVNPTLTLNGFNKDYPLGEKELIGPDVWWKWSKNPQLVQMVLMARLIGGNYWEYALGNLEQNQQEALL